MTGLEVSEKKENSTMTPQLEDYKIERKKEV